jgi:hypothetical protein
MGMDDGLSDLTGVDLAGLTRVEAVAWLGMDSSILIALNESRPLTIIHKVGGSIERVSNHDFPK